MKLGIIGFGNMAEAILGGILESGFVNKKDVVASGKDDAMLAKASDKYGIGVQKDNCKVVEDSDVILLSVKPQILAEVISEIKGVCTQDKLIVSIVAGKTQEWIANAFGCAHKVVRCMPNTPALVGEGCTGICFSESVTDDEKVFALKMFNCVGKAMEVPEKLMDVVVGCIRFSCSFSADLRVRNAYLLEKGKRVHRGSDKNIFEGLLEIRWLLLADGSVLYGNLQLLDCR